MYAPGDDSLMLLECIKAYSGRAALEIGVGSCLIADSLRQNFETVIGTDIDIEAIRFCKSHGSRVHLICCDAATALRGSFDLIVSNPPYLPNDYARQENASRSDRTIYGGPTGIEVTMHFIQSAYLLLAPAGKMLFVI